VIQPDATAGPLSDQEPLLPHATRLADIMNQPEIPGEVSSAERRAELTGTLCRAAQMVV
jgi:hypothetical protein